jgi:pyruvate dehydrogenase E2 component (dihydrolipoamide acetyltransferase)
MATPVVMPSFGMYTSEGTLVNWLYPDGARVKQGESILEIETEKAVNPVIAPAGGILCHAAQIGALIKEQELLGYILAEGESAPPAPGAAPQTPMGNSPDRPQASSSKPGSPAEGRVKASPAAKKLASEHGIDLASIVASGPGGRVVEADVRVALDQRALSPAAAHGPAAGRLIPLSPMRRTIGERLRRSLDSAASLTITREVEAGELVGARKVLSEKLKVSVPYDALFVKLLAEALRENPGLNAVIENDSLRISDEVNVCFAVAVAEGLVVPVVRNADRATVLEITSQMSRLTAQARSNSLRSEALSGGCSTVTNLGAYGVDIFTPILNPPQASILGIGRIAERPVARQGAVSAAQTCWLSLTFDHRVADGVPAASVLESIAKRMADGNYLCSLA